MPVQTVIWQQAGTADEHLVVWRIAVVVQPGPVAAERRLEPSVQVAAQIFVPVERLFVDRQGPVDLCNKQ